MPLYFNWVKEIYTKNPSIQAPQFWQELCKRYYSEGTKWYHRTYPLVSLAKRFIDESNLTTTQSDNPAINNFSLHNQVAQPEIKNEDKPAVSSKAIHKFINTLNMQSQATNFNDASRELTRPVNQEPIVDETNIIRLMATLGGRDHLIQSNVAEALAKLTSQLTDSQRQYIFDTVLTSLFHENSLIQYSAIQALKKLQVLLTDSNKTELLQKLLSEIANEKLFSTICTCLELYGYLATKLNDHAQDEREKLSLMQIMFDITKQRTEKFKLLQQAEIEMPITFRMALS